MHGGMGMLHVHVCRGKNMYIYILMIKLMKI